MLCLPLEHFWGLYNNRMVILVSQIFSKTHSCLYLFHFLDLCIYLIHISILSDVCVCTMCMAEACRGQRRALNPVELGLWRFWAAMWVLEFGPGSPSRAKSVLNHWGPYLFHSSEQLWEVGKFEVIYPHFIDEETKEDKSHSSWLLRSFADIPYSVQKPNCSENNSIIL